jgi:hypothetical protein
VSFSTASLSAIVSDFIVLGLVTGLKTRMNPVF